MKSHASSSFSTAVGRGGEQAQAVFALTQAANQPAGLRAADNAIRPYRSRYPIDHARRFRVGADCGQLVELAKLLLAA